MEDQTVVVDLLARNEEAISELYEAYAYRFPDYEDLWTSLANDERKHASWIRNLSSYVEEGRFNIAAIQSFSKYLDCELAKAQDPNMLLINALSIAKYIEEALIERKYFESFEGDSVEVKHILRDLAIATEKHLDRVQRAWSKEK